MNIFRRLLGIAPHADCISYAQPSYTPTPLNPDPTVCLGCQEDMNTVPDKTGAPVHVSDDGRHWFPCKAKRP